MTAFALSVDTIAEAVSGENETWALVNARIDEDFRSVETENRHFDIDTSHAFETFAKRIELRDASYANVNKIIADIQAGLDAAIEKLGLLDAESPIGALFNLYFGALRAVENALASARFDMITDIINALRPLSDAASVLRQVQKVIQPLLDFIFPVTLLIDAALASLESARGITALQDKLSNSIQSALNDALAPLSNALQNSLTTFEDLKDLLVDVF